MSIELNPSQKELAMQNGPNPKNYKERLRGAAVQDGNMHRRIPARAVLELCGDVSAMTLHRWLNNPELNFPKPQYIGRRRYWREADIIAWLDAKDEQRGAA